MKIVLWIGYEANQIALAHKIHSQFPVSGIVAEKKKSKRKLSLKLIAEKIIEKIFLSAINKAWFGMLEKYKITYPELPHTTSLQVENINSDEAYNFTKQLDADLIIVSGTRLVKDKLLSIRPSIGILNLHTGLSPYIKGGPNCTNWCIATKQFHLIGNTIMWIDAGIDTGNIVCTELTEVSGNENLNELHSKVMEHAHHLYVVAIQNLVAKRLSNVPQKQICEGNTYYTRQWTLIQKLRLLKNFKSFSSAVNSDFYAVERKKIKTVNFS